MAAVPSSAARCGCGAASARAGQASGANCAARRRAVPYLSVRNFGIPNSGPLILGREAALCVPPSSPHAASVVADVLLLPPPPPPHARYRFVRPFIYRRYCSRESAIHLGEGGRGGVIFSEREFPGRHEKHLSLSHSLSFCRSPLRSFFISFFLPTS